MTYNRLAPLLNANYYMFGSQTMFDRVWLTTPMFDDVSGRQRIL